jgi:cell shape-determining protein MreD
MVSIYLLILKRFIFLVLIQGLIFNNFDFFEIYDPYVCLVFIITFPVKVNKITFMIISFVFGFALDLYTNTLGINTAACLSIAFLRSYILNFVFGSFYDPHGIKLMKNYVIESTFSQKFLYISSIILIHHLILFSLETFSFEFISLIIIKTVITSIISLIFCATFIYIMIENEK